MDLVVGFSTRRGPRDSGEMVSVDVCSLVGFFFPHFFCALALVGGCMIVARMIIYSKAQSRHCFYNCI